MKRLLTFFWFLVLVAVASGGIDEDFQTAVDLYDRGDFASAAAYFQGIIDKGYSSPQLYYNAGCAYYKAGSIGLAIANFRRAERLAPDDEDIKANLRFAQLFAVDKVEDRSMLFSEQVVALAGTFTPNQYFFASLVALGFAFLHLSLVRLGLIRKWRRLPVAGLFTLFLVAVVAMTITVRANYLIEEGVIVVEQTEVLSGPGTEFELQFEGHEGLMFQILDERPDYYLGLFANKLKGWVRKSAVLEI